MSKHSEIKTRMVKKPVTPRRFPRFPYQPTRMMKSKGIKVVK